MIKLTRDRAKTAIHRQFRGKDRVTLELRLLQAQIKILRGEQKGHKFSSSIWRKAKKQLKRETRGKCAYCEATTDVVAHGDVEHFRPKSEYWWLAYCYDNYLYSCQLCNQTFKGKEFPRHGSRLAEPTVDPEISEADLEAMAGRLSPDPCDDALGLPAADFTTLTTGEGAGLPNPYEQDPEPLFSWSFDEALKEVAIQARDENQANLRALEAVHSFLGLNRPELKRERWNKLKTLITFRRILASEDVGDDVKAFVRTEIKDLISDHAAFAGMARFFVTNEWQLNLQA